MSAVSVGARVQFKFCRLLPRLEMEFCTLDQQAPEVLKLLECGTNDGKEKSLMFGHESAKEGKLN